MKVKDLKQKLFFIGYTTNQVDTIVEAALKGLDVSPILDPNLNYMQMQGIISLYGVTDNVTDFVDVQIPYANFKYLKNIIALKRLDLAKKYKYYSCTVLEAIIILLTEKETVSEEVLHFVDQLPDEARNDERCIRTALSITNLTTDYNKLIKLNLTKSTLTMIRLGLKEGVTVDELCENYSEIPYQFETNIYSLIDDRKDSREVDTSNIMHLLEF
jgi:hypothetical protein